MRFAGRQDVGVREVKDDSGDFGLLQEEEDCGGADCKDHIRSWIWAYLVWVTSESKQHLEFRGEKGVGCTSM